MGANARQLNTQEPQHSSCVLQTIEKYNTAGKLWYKIIAQDLSEVFSGCTAKSPVLMSCFSFTFCVLYKSHQSKCQRPSPKNYRFAIFVNKSTVNHSADLHATGKSSRSTELGLLLYVPQSEGTHSPVVWCLWNILIALEIFSENE